MSIEPPVQLESPVQPLHSSPGCSPCPSSPSIMATAMMSPPAATTVSASAPEIHTRRTLSASPVAPSPSLDAALVSSPRNSSPDALASVNNSPNNASTSSDGSEPDPQIVEALRSKDRIYVLKLGEQMESLINERRARIDLTPATSYQRLLVHRCSAYYRLIPETDPGTKNIIVYFRTESRIPSRRISELVPAEESAQPAFKIMRRSAQDGPKSRHNSQTGSVAGEDADLSDIEPSEAGSIGGRSNATGGSKRHMTLEERAAAYNEARSRIFMGFEEKEKEKEKDMSANSSTFSLVSGSGSTSGGRSSGGDADDSASSAATESEWSGPVTRDKRDSRRGGSGGSSSRSMRSSGASYNNGSGSSRNSRATSPSFTYASLYDGPPTSSLDPTQYGQQSPPGYIAHCYYPYGQPPGQPYMLPYSYYPPYTWGPPPQHPAPHHSDPASPAGGEPMYPHPQTSAQQVAYVNPYMWLQSPPSHIPQQQSTSSLGLNLPPQTSHTSPPQPQNVPQYLAYTPAPPHYNPYAFTPYQPTSPPVYPPDQQMPAPPPIQGQPLWLSDMTTHTPTGHTNSNGNSAENNHHIRASSRNSGSHHGGGSSKRGMPRRGAWSYGPGAGSGGYTWNVAGLSGGGGGNDVVGPRLSSSVRRISGTSSGSGSAGTRTPGDEASSTAVSRNSFYFVFRSRPRF
ncbi:hypothetical protein AcV5_009202 [Taiwanofungus camphoratus]|nr:hypothetical protein AcV5_009202 [Antrodia cinnamomea]